MDIQKIIDLAQNVHMHGTEIELLAEEGDPGSITEARLIVPKLLENIQELSNQLQASKAEGMTVGDIRAALLDYSENVMPQIRVRNQEMETTYNPYYEFYCVEKIADKPDSSPTVPVICLDKGIEG
jgi:hypothetical protein